MVGAIIGINLDLKSGKVGVQSPYLPLSQLPMVAAQKVGRTLDPRGLIEVYAYGYM